MRTTFLVDGFNVYHSAVDIERDFGLRVKWLDLDSLFRSYLHLFGKDAKLESVYYFTALAYHLHDAAKVKRHETYIQCLRQSGVIDQQGRFKQKSTFTCRKCGNKRTPHEEKETDVAIASKMFEVLIADDCDRIVLVTGDTDLAPAAKTAIRLFPKKEVVFAFPYKRKNVELAHIAPRSFSMRKEMYALNQLPDPCPLPDGTTAAKPPKW